MFAFCSHFINQPDHFLALVLPCPPPASRISPLCWHAGGVIRGQQPAYEPDWKEGEATPPAARLPHRLGAT